MPLSNYKGNSSSSAPLTSDTPYRVTLDGPIPDVFNVEPPVLVDHGDTPYAIADAAEVSFRTFLADTSGGILTIELPPAPVDGEIVNVKRVTTDGATLTIDGNGSNIEGAASDISDTNTDLVSYQLQFADADGSWWII